MEPMTERDWYEFMCMVRRIHHFGKDKWKAAALEMATQSDIWDTHEQFIDVVVWLAAWVDGMLP